MFIPLLGRFYKYLDFETMSLESNEDISNSPKNTRSRARFPLQQLERELLSQLQQLEKDVNLEGVRYEIELVALDWGINLMGIWRMAEFVQMKVAYSIVRRNPGMLNANCTKTLIAANNYDTSSLNKSNHSLSPTTKENKVGIHPKTDYLNIHTKNTNVYSPNKIHQSETNRLTRNLKPMCSNQTHSTSAYAFRTVCPPFRIRQLNDNKFKDRPTHLERIPTITSESNKSTLSGHASYNETRQPVMHLSESNPSRGLWNLGNTCYMNSILQCLSHTLPLREFYVSDEYKQFLNKRGDLSSAFKRVMVELWDSTSQQSVDPYDLRREVKARTDRFPDYTQHDAHEFMGFLLNELHEEINRASEEGRKSPADNETLREACARHLTWEESRISELFGGMLRSEVCCSVCSDKSIVHIPFMGIALPIQKTTEESYYHFSSSTDAVVQLDTCLEIFTHKETLDGDLPCCNKYIEPNLYSVNLAGKEVTICLSTSEIATFSIPFYRKSNTLFISDEKNVGLRIFNELSITLICRRNSLIGLRIRYVEYSLPQHIALSLAKPWIENTYVQPFEGRREFPFASVTGGNNSQQNENSFHNNQMPCVPNCALRIFGNNCCMSSIIQQHLISLRLFYVFDEYNRFFDSSAFNQLVIAELWSVTSSHSVSKTELQFTGVTEGNDSQQDEDLTLYEQSETAPPSYAAPQPLNPPAPPPTKICENKVNYASPNKQKNTYGRMFKKFLSNTLQFLTPDKSQQAVNIQSIPTYGLRNTRNTCYMNSILQCLSHTLPLREFYVSDEYKQFLNERGDLSSAFKRVMLELWDSNSQHPVDPYDLRREVKARTDRFPDYTQHDAHEFMRFLLNELHEGINRASVKGRKSPADNETLGEACARHLTWEDSRISELFGGMLRSDVCCSVCSDKSIVYIPFMDIALPIPSWHDRTTVSDCLAFLREEETLDEEERPYCNKCMDLTKSTKQLFVSSFPRFLVIQLKRFSYYPTRTKLTTPVKFTETWRLKDSSDKTHTYYLYGISCHSGGLHGGHYVAYCCYKGIWRCFNDSMVSTVNWDHVKRQEAYILFYMAQ